jgi:hypothetical protein
LTPRQSTRAAHPLAIIARVGKKTSLAARIYFDPHQRSGRLVLTKVEPDEPGSTVGKDGAPKKKRAGRWRQAISFVHNRFGVTERQS